MKIKVKVKTKSKTQSIERVGEGDFLVKVKSKPDKGKANAEVIKVLGKHFKIPQSQIKILSGVTSSRKIISIEK